MTLVDARLLADLNYWYAREARYLDERRYDLWLQLVDEGIRYQVPTRYLTEQLDVEAFETWAVERELAGESDILLVDDDHDGILRRIARLSSGMGWSEMPPSLTRRVVSNVEPLEQTDSGETRVASALVVFKSRGPHERSCFSAQRRDLLVPAGGDYRLKRRTVIVDDTVLLGENLSILL